MKTKRYGSEVPRIYTPELRELTPETTLGFAAIEFAEEVIGLKLFPWQKWLLKHMLELQENGQLRFRTVVLLISRQNGKTVMGVILALFFMYVLGRPLVIGTAQDLGIAEDVWEDAVELIMSTPELRESHLKTYNINGQKSVKLQTGEEYKVRAANRKAGRGLSGDLVLLDELREHQKWDAWSAISKTTLARESSLVLAMSNAGDLTSVVLAHLRKMAHLALGDPDGICQDLVLHEDEEDDEDALAIFEWSAPPEAGVWDREYWPLANPSMEYSALSERSLASAARTDPESVFKTECLCQWVDGVIEGPFPEGTWKACEDTESEIVGPVFAAADLSSNRGWTYIAFAGRRADGLIHVEVVAQRAGTDWVADWLHLRTQTWGIHEIAVPHRSTPISALVDELTLAGLPLEDITANDQAKATGIFYDLVRDGKLRHRDQPALNIPAGIAQMKQLSGGAWVWDRQQGDISALIAATAAVWLVDRYSQPQIMPRIHVWSDDEEDEVT